MKTVFPNGGTHTDCIKLAQKIIFDPAKVRPGPLDPRGFQKTMQQLENHPAFLQKTRFKK